MLLAVDVGNTQTVLGLYEGERLVDDWRLATERTPHGRRARRPARRAARSRGRDGICLACTVPTLVREWERLAERWAHARLLVVGPGVKTGLPIRYDDPREVGPDRIVNSVAAKSRYGAPVIVVDFGTSTNFDVVSADGRVRRRCARAGHRDLDGGAVRACGPARQGRLRGAASVIGKTTVAGLQSGLVYGFAGQVDGIVAAVRGELGAPDAPVVATGGLAALIAPHAATIGTRRPVPDARRAAAGLGA